MKIVEIILFKNYFCIGEGWVIFWLMFGVSKERLIGLILVLLVNCKGNIFCVRLLDLWLI